MLVTACDDTEAVFFQASNAADKFLDQTFTSSLTKYLNSFQQTKEVKHIPILGFNLLLGTTGVAQTQTWADLQGA